MNRSTSEMERRITRGTKFAGLLLALGCASTLSAQLNSAIKTISLTATSSEPLSISIIAGGSVTFTPIQAGVSVSGNVVPAFTTSWTLNGSRTSVKRCAYFSSTAKLQGTSSQMDDIPASDFTGAPDGGSAAPFTATIPFGAGWVSVRKTKTEIPVRGD